MTQNTEPLALAASKERYTREQALAMSLDAMKSLAKRLPDHEWDGTYEDHESEDEWRFVGFATLKVPA